MIKIALALLAIVAGCGSPSPTPGPRPAPAPAPASGDVARLINAERAGFGLPALAEVPDADALARSWAASMARAEVLTHGTFGDRIAQTFPGHAAGEDIAAGQPDAPSVVAAWMASVPHRANILGPFASIGVGEAVSPRGVRYWCVDFIR